MKTFDAICKRLAKFIDDTDTQEGYWIYLKPGYEWADDPQNGGLHETTIKRLRDRATLSNIKVNPNRR